MTFPGYTHFFVFGPVECGYMFCVISSLCHQKKNGCCLTLGFVSS